MSETATKKKKHIETATEKYMRLRSQDFEGFLGDSFAPEVLEKAVLHTLTSPSGMGWQVRRLSSEFYAVSGSLPMSLAAKIRKGPDAEGEGVTAEDEDKIIAFSTKAIRYGCVHPRLVDSDNPGPDELPFDLVTLEDYDFLGGFLIGEGKEAARLSTFRK